MTYYAIYQNLNESGILGKNPPLVISKNKKILETRIKNSEKFYIEKITSLPEPEEICIKGQWYEQPDKTYVFTNMKPVSNENLSKILSN